MPAKSQAPPPISPLSAAVWNHLESADRHALPSRIVIICDSSASLSIAHSLLINESIDSQFPFKDRSYLARADELSALIQWRQDELHAVHLINSAHPEAAAYLAQLPSLTMVARHGRERTAAVEARILQATAKVRDPNWQPTDRRLDA